MNIEEFIKKYGCYPYQNRDINDLEGEIWMTHPKWDWLQASNYGRIKSLERDIVKSNGVTEHKKEFIRKQRPTDDGYLQFNVKKNGDLADSPYVHRFCYECFHQVIIPKDRKKYQINHKSEVKIENFIENLELVTAKKNINHGTHNERVSKTLGIQVGQYTLDGKLVKIWESMVEAEREGGFMHQAISKCCNNKFHREGNNIYKNFIWQYVEKKEDS